MKCAPLTWPASWDKRGYWRDSLWGITHFGWNKRIHRGICDQLERRSDWTPSFWDAFDRDHRRIERTISPLLQLRMAWPNDRFLPDDPFEILTWHCTDSEEQIDVLDEIERVLGLAHTGWREREALLASSYGDVIRSFAARCKERGI